MENCKFDPNDNCRPLSCLLLSNNALDATNNLMNGNDKPFGDADLDREEAIQVGVEEIALEVRKCALDKVLKLGVFKDKIRNVT